MGWVLEFSFEKYFRRVYVKEGMSFIDFFRDYRVGGGREFRGS